MIWKKSILAKMLFGILTPLIIILLIAAIIILTNVGNTTGSLTESELNVQSKAAALEVSEFFTQYNETVSQMCTNNEIKDLLSDIGTGDKANESDYYDSVSKTLTNILSEDSGNITLVWLVDLDSGESIRSEGVIKGLPDYDITERSWYIELMEKQSLFITEPYEDSATGAMVVSILKPIYKSGSEEMLGAAAVDLTLEQIGTMMDSFVLGDTGFFILSSQQGVLLSHPDSANKGKNIAETDISKEIVDAIASQSEGSYTYSMNGATIHGYLSKIGSNGWSVLTGLPDQEYSQAFNNIALIILITFGLGTVLIAFAVFLISKTTIKPIKKLSAIADEIANGNLNVTVSVNTKDETAQLADSIARTVTRLQDYIKYIDEIAMVLNQIADGNLDYQLTHAYTGEFSAIKEALLNISEKLTDTIKQISAASNYLAAGAEQIAGAAQSMAEGATEQAGTVQELTATTAAAAEKMNDSAKNAKKSAANNNDVGDLLYSSNEKMNQAIGAMNEISDSFDKISQIITSIEGIANQTNLLSLNAAIEAARAGDAGKGFAVVAQEVRSLSGESAEAVNMTRALLDEASKVVEKGELIINSTAEQLQAVVKGATESMQLMVNVSEASEAQVQSFDEIADGMEHISHIIQMNAASAEENSAAGEELAAQSDALNKLIGGFTVRSD